MTERTIYLHDTDPIHILGINDIRLINIKQCFPKLKIVARGHEIKIYGDADEISRLESKISKMLDYVQRHKVMHDVEFIQILNNETVVQSSNENDEDIIVYGNNGKVIKAKTTNQKNLIKAVDENDLVFTVGPAGSGKTYMAMALAVRALRNREIRRIVLTRPAVEAGEQLGFLPGDMKDKLDPYLQPIYDALQEMINYKKLTEYIEDGTIQIAPLAYMRGRTLGNAFVILDEAQNATLNQLKMFLTRMGHNAKFIVTGDLTQIDLPQKHQSGLIKVIDMLSGIEGISVVAFDSIDIVRHSLVRKIVDVFDKIEKK